MFHGSIVALITPFRNGSIDEAALQSLVEWHVAQGTHGLVPVGTTGESPTLSHAEHERVVELVIEAAAGRRPVIAGAGSNSTAEAISLARHAKAAGADGVLVVTPYYNKPTQDGLYAHFKAIHDAADLPLVIYNIPGRSVVDMSVDTMAAPGQAAEHRRRQGRDRRPRPAAAHAARLRRRVLPAVRRGHHRARLPRQRRRRLHLGDRQRRAPPVRRDAGGLGPGRREGGARDPPAPARRCTRRCSSRPARRRSNTRSRGSASAPRTCACRWSPPKARPARRSMPPWSRPG